MNKEKNPITEILSKQPGLKSREIANLIGMEKKDISNFLYLNDKFIQDKNYYWYLKKDLPKKKDNKKKEIQKTVLTDLSNYYLSCLGRDDDSGIHAFASSKDLDYVELETSSLTDNNSLFSSNEAQRLFGKMRKNRGKLEMYFGYPTTLKKIISKKNGQTYFFVEPILLFPVEMDGGSPSINPGFPIFNLSVLKRFTNAEKEQIMDELIQLEDELGFNSENQIPELDDLVRRLKKIRPEWPWIEDIKPESLPLKPLLDCIKQEGIYNRAILVVGERSPYTQGLESELKSLSKLSPSDYEETALGQWIKGDIIKGKEDEKSPLLEVLPLNSEQREAIQRSLTNSLTVITGPPGTGKSQVVTNLLVNAVWRKKKILFASKNNKAVNVVESRVNNLGNRPFLLRMGSKEYQAKLAEYLIGLLTSTFTEDDKENFDFEKKKYKEIKEKFLELDKQEEELIILRNKTDELDQLIEDIRKDFSIKSFNELKKIDVDKFKKFIKPFLKSLKDADKEEQFLFVKLFWKFLKEKRYEDFQEEVKKIKPIISKLENNLPSKKIDNKTIKDWLDISEKFNNYSLSAQAVQKYMESLKIVQKTKSLEDISKEKMVLMKKKTLNAKNIWKSWLRLQPYRLSKEDRKLLNQYSALLKMVIDVSGDLYTKLGKDIYKQYSNISKQVSHLLPAWAITSLSARGKLPFEAGYFDIVVFDEASQCDIASALPLLYRAKQAVIIGDKKQLSHISSIHREQDRQLFEKHNLVSEYANWSYSYNSLFDLSVGLISSQDNIVQLKNHYRSHKNIIEFSNKEFYNENLRMATNYDHLKFFNSEKDGIRWINIVGSVKRPSSGGAVNKKEAEKVVSEIRNIVVKKKYKGTIGVVTPFRAHANLIRRIINEDEVLSAELINHDFLVDVVHKFQGDERDLMIFSLVVSKNMPKGALWFMKNNGNLFNVAITRARAMLLVIGDQNAIINCKISYLENFAKYIQQIKIKSKKEKKIVHSVKDLGKEYPKVSDPEKVSEWEYILYKKLYKAGIKVLPQYQVDKYILDFALFDGDRMLDIEVDGERYHRNWTGELCRRDQIRNQRLFELRWDVKRFWVYEVRDDIDNCVKKIKEWLKNKK